MPRLKFSSAPGPSLYSGCFIFVGVPLAMANSRDRRTLRRALRESGLGVVLKPTPLPPLPKQVPFWKKIPLTAYLLLGVLALAITLLEGYPWLSIQRDDSLSSTNPYATALSIANEGYIPVTELDVDCAVDYGDKDYTTGIRDSVFAYHNFSQWLAHGDRATLPCLKAATQMAALLPSAKTVDVATLTVYVTFAFIHLNLKFLRRTQIFHFTAIRADDGSLHWMFIH